MPRTTTLVRVPKTTAKAAADLSQRCGVTAGAVVAAAVELHGKVIQFVLVEGGGKHIDVGADPLLDAFTRQVLETYGKPGLLVEVAKLIEDRARELATAALPHHVARAVKLLCAEHGLPEPPIRTLGDGTLEIGDPPPGVTAPDRTDRKRIEA